MLSSYNRPVHNILCALSRVLPSTGAVGSQRAAKVTVWHYDKNDTSPRRQADASTRVESHGLMTYRYERLPNLGRNDGTNLMHLIRHWDHLAELIIFLKDTTGINVYLGEKCCQPRTYTITDAQLQAPEVVMCAALERLHLILSVTGVLPKILTLLRRSPANLRAWCPHPTKGIERQFRLSGYVSRSCRQQIRRTGEAVDTPDFNLMKQSDCYDTDGVNFTLALQRPLVRWMAAHQLLRARSGPASIHYCSGGEFATSGSAVRQRSRAFYRTLLRDVQAGSNSEAGHYMERSWFAALHAFAALNASAATDHGAGKTLHKAASATVAVYTVDVALFVGQGHLWAGRAANNSTGIRSAPCADRNTHRFLSRSCCS